MKFSLTLLFIVNSLLLFSQHTQTVRGIVIDKDIKTGLPYVNIYVLDSISIGTITDTTGKFELNNVPIGRHVLIISYLGYKTVNLPIIVNSGRSIYLEIEMEPDINSLEEVVIKGSRYDKKKAINNVAVTSVRVFSIEETEKYAGSLGDPARMAQNFAGVSNAGDSRNDIVIRGNSPYGLLWRIDGVEVANPNHFGAKGSTGGPVTILNNNLLTNSDFFTSAFPAEYGNAFSGVFDLRMRKGNSKNFEKIFQVGWNGIEFGIEGPIKPEKSSFIAAYRYSNLKFLEKMNFDIGVNGVPEYQDITIKTDFNTKHAGNFSIVLIGGLSNIQIERGTIGQSSYEALWDINTENNKIISFVNNKIKINKKSSLKNYLSFSLDESKIVLDSSLTNNTRFLFASIDETDYSFSIGSTFRTRINKKNKLDIGYRIYRHGVKYIDSTYSTTINNTPVYYIFTDVTKNNLWQFQSFIQWKHNFSNQFFSSVGINYNHLLFNNTYSIEPRVGVSYSFKKHRFGIGYGLVGKPLPYIIYFVKDENTNELNNYNLTFFKSHQFSLSDNLILTQNFRIKIEAYYQYLFNIPIEKELSYFSLINFGAEFFQERPENLMNSGKGKNYGIEFTIEKFYNNNWYFLSTLSLFESKYLASDSKWRDSQFNNNYIVNILGGYEFNLKNNYVFQINNKLTLAGGRPVKEYMPDGSINENTVFTQRSSSYFRDDLQFSLIKNYKKTTHELSIDLQNITNHKNEYMRNYNEKTQQVEVSYQMGFLPILKYRLTF